MLAKDEETNCYLSKRADICVGHHYLWKGCERFMEVRCHDFHHPPCWLPLDFFHPPPIGHS